MPRSPMSFRHGWSGKAWSSNRVRRSQEFRFQTEKGESMRRLGIVLAVSLAAGSAWAQGKEPIALRDMGSFHVGGRVIEITGQPIKEIVFTPGGVPAKMDPNGKYQVAQMYVQYFLPQNRRGRLPLLMWHGGGLTGVTYETTPDGPIPSRATRCPCRWAIPGSASASARPVRGTTTRPSARLIPAPSSRSRPTRSS